MKSFKDYLKERNLDGSGGGDCLNSTPEENREKFNNNYRKFIKAVMNKHGQLTPELYKKIDKAWKSKKELKEANTQKVEIDGMEYEIRNSSNPKRSKGEVIVNAMSAIKEAERYIREINNFYSDKNKEENPEKAYEVMSKIVRKLVQNYPENTEIETKKYFKDFISKAKNTKYVKSKSENKNIKVKLSPSEIMKNYPEIKAKALEYLKSNIKALKLLIDVSKSGVVMNPKSAENKADKINREKVKILLKRGNGKVKSKKILGYGWGEDYEDGDEFMNLEKARKYAEKGRKISEETMENTLTIKLLKEAYEYKGSHFMENYVYSNFLKGFVNDVYEFGLEETIDLYTDFYGEETAPIYEEIADNFETFSYLTESTGLLFEGYLRLDEKLGSIGREGGAGLLGIKDLAKHSFKGNKMVGGIGKSYRDYVDPNVPSFSFATRGPKMIDAMDGKLSNTAKDIKNMIRVADMNTKSQQGAIQAAKEAAKASGATTATQDSLLARAGGEAKGLLSSLWMKLKELGKPIFDKIGKFLKPGITWAKDLIHQGMSWFTVHPLAQIAVPAIAIAGGTAAAIKLINKARKAKGKKKMSSSEVEKFKAIAKEKDDEIKKLKKKAS